MENQAFGLPRNTVRACLSIMLVSTICIGFINGMISKEVIGSLASMSIAFYFSKKDKE